MSPLAWLWSNDELSDVRLQLCTSRPAAAIATDPGRPPPSSSTSSGAHAVGDENAPGKRGAEGSPERSQPHKLLRCSTAELGTNAEADSSPKALAASPGEPDAAGGLHGTVSYRLHASVLASGSTYFRKRITQQSTAGLRYADDGSRAERGAAADVHVTRCLLVEHVEEGELGAMEAVLRHAYTTKLCAEGADVAQTTVAELLQMLVLADRFDVTLCVTHLCEELATRSDSEFDFAAINTVLSGAPAGWQSEPAFRRVAETATQRLLQIFGDVDPAAEDMCFPGSKVEAQLQQLSLPSLLVLLSSDSLRSSSENSVLRLAAEWLTGLTHEGSRHCSDAALRQVASALRLGRLSHTYTHCVVAHMSWLKLSAAEYTSLLHFSAAGGEGPRSSAAGRTARQEHLIHSGGLAGPATWYSAPPRAAPIRSTAATYDWELSKDFLQGRLLTASQTSAPSIPLTLLYTNGFAVHIYLYVDGVAGAGGVRLGCMLSSNLHEVDGHDHGVLCSLSLGAFTASNELQEAEFSGVCTSDEVCLAVPLLVPPCPGVFDIAGWEGFMVEDKVRMQCTIAQCE